MQQTVDFYTNILGMKLVKTLEFTDDSGSGQHFFFDVGNGRDAIAFFWFEDAPESAPGITQSGRWIDGAPRRSAIGAMDHVALDVPREKIEEYHDSLRAKGVEVTEIVNHSDQPGKDQYLPDEPTADTFVRSIYFQDPNGVTIELLAWHTPPPAGMSLAEVLKRAQARRKARGAEIVEDEDVRAAIAELGSS